MQVNRNDEHDGFQILTIYQMKNGKKLKDLPKEIFGLLVRFMMSLGATKTAIQAVACMLPYPEQQYKLREWISKTMETSHEPTEGEIVEQAMLIGDEEK